MPGSGYGAVTATGRRANAGAGRVRSGHALEHRLNANLLFTWRSRHLRTLRVGAPTPKMLPVMVEATSALDGKSLHRAAASVIEIELAAGRIRPKGAVDVETLRAVVDLLARR